MTGVPRSEEHQPVPVMDSETGYWYVPSHDREEAWFVDDPDDLLIENVYMRPVPPPPIEERHDGEPAVSRDKYGRFRRAVWWEVCSADHPGAVPYMELRYPPS